MPTVLLLLAVLLTLLATAGAAVDWWRRLGARRFDAAYERNLLRRTGRGHGYRSASQDDLIASQSRLASSRSSSGTDPNSSSSRSRYPRKRTF